MKSAKQIRDMYVNINSGEPFGSVEIVKFVTKERYRLGNVTTTTITEHHRMVVGQFPGALLRAISDPPKKGRTYA